MQKSGILMELRDCQVIPISTRLINVAANGVGRNEGRLQDRPPK